ncbi:MAG TPA: HAMP domain-containing sensor histidine kinase [Limnochordia bacterium]|nr:HAMP domain-containing sensor histidine kinase [Limnochordia bacterium]
MRFAPLPRTLRGRLTAGYIVVLALLILALTAFQYRELREFLIEHTIESMAGEFRSAARAPDVRLIPALPQPKPQAALAFNLARALASANRTVWIYDTTGTLGARVGARSDVYGDLLLPPFEALAAIQLGRTHAPFLWRQDGHTWLVASYRVGPLFAPGGYAIVAQSFDDGVFILDRFVAFSLLGGLVVLGLALLGGLVFGARALAPLKRLITASRRVEAGDYAQRVETRGATTELQQVGAALNQALDSVEHALLAERQAQARIRRFVADAAHELRTPVTALNGFLEVLGEHAHDRETLTRSLGVMRSEGARLARMVNQLLDLARLDRQVELKLAPLDLGGLLQNLVPALDVLAGDHDLQARWAEAPTPIAGDADALKQVVWNLVDNAARYSPPGTAIEIETSLERGQVALRVADRGPGIPPDDLPHIFERFYRGNRVRTESGTGLGLAIVTSLVDAHKAQIGLGPRAGGGTEVVIRFPLLGSRAA